MLISGMPRWGPRRGNTESGSSEMVCVSNSRTSSAVWRLPCSRTRSTRRSFSSVTRWPASATYTVGWPTFVVSARKTPRQPLLSSGTSRAYSTFPGKFSKNTRGLMSFCTCVATMR